MYFAKAFIKVKNLDVLMTGNSIDVQRMLSSIPNSSSYGLIDMNRYNALNRLYLNSLPSYIVSSDILRVGSDSIKSMQIINKDSLPDWYKIYGTKADVNNDGLVTVELLVNYTKTDMLCKANRKKFSLDSVKNIIYHAINCLPGIEVEHIDIVESVYFCPQFIYDKKFSGLPKMSIDDTIFASIFGKYNLKDTEILMSDNNFVPSKIAKKNRNKPYIQKALGINKYEIDGKIKISKVLVRKRDDIVDVLSDYVNELYDKGHLLSKRISIYDIGTISKSIMTHSDASLLNDSFNADEILSGSTLVFYVDIPNALARSESVQELKEGSHYELDKTKDIEDEGSNDGENDESKKETKKLETYLSNLNSYGLDRESDDGYGVMKDVERGFSYLEMINTIRKAISNTDNDDSKELLFLQRTPSPIKDLVGVILKCLDNGVNVVFAYSDTIAYDEEFFIKDYLNHTLSSLTIPIYGLSNHSMFSNPKSNKRRISNFIKQVLEEDIGDYNSEIFNKIYNSAIENLTDPDNDDTEMKIKSSVPGFEYLIYSAYSVLSGNSTIVSKDDNGLSCDEGCIDDAFDMYDEMLFPMHKNNLMNNFFKFKPNVSIQNISSTDISELDKMIGLKSVKEECDKFAAFLLINKRRQELGYNSNSVSRHMVFTGNPGTAKSTTAILLAKKLFKMGVLVNPKVTMTSRDSLIERYVGWTAKKVEETIKSARGGILFVDEAYSLMDGDYKSYGYEAINTFVNYMEQKSVRDTTIIIFAGYRDEMKKFLQSNPGLPSRVTIIDFPDYNIDELMDIAKVIAESKAIKLSDGFMNKLKEVSSRYVGTKNFGNGRFIRNIIEKSMLTQAYRLSKNIAFVTEEELNTLEEIDFTFKDDDYNISDKEKIGFIL